jgi:hypothetical protein
MLLLIFLKILTFYINMLKSILYLLSAYPMEMTSHTYIQGSSMPIPGFDHHMMGSWVNGSK